MGKRAQNKVKKGWHSAALIIGVAAFAVLVYLLSAFASAARTTGASYSTSGGYGMMGGMMSGNLDQGNITLCNQMMQGFGLNQSIIDSMDKMMSSGTAAGMDMHMLG